MAIVDDDPGVLDSLKFLLELAGHVVSTYTSAAAFLEDRDTQPACLVLDYFMPQMTGLDLVARLRLDGVNLPVLLITSAPSPVIVARAAQLGIDKVLEKPPDERDLLLFLDAHC
ncbi:MAG: response regulator [Acetobacteraceae bacterium]|nr:response regulator [Acetobacteraceae bacterium]